MESAVTVSDYDRPGVIVVTLNRPERHNALNRQLIGELTTVFATLGKRQDVRAVVLTGAGRSFCAGADLQGTKRTAEAGFDLALEEGQSLFDLLTAIDTFPLPVIGRINGSAIGGGMGLLSCCDIAVGVDRAVFGFSEARLGLIPAVISPFVVSKIGWSGARELFLTAERFDAARAREIGLLHWIVSETELNDRMAERIDHLLLGAPGAQKAVKRLMRASLSLSREEMRGFTSDLFARRITSQEGREGIQAFLEKRAPDWIS